MAFTSDEEYRRGEAATIIHNFIGSMLEGCADMSDEGIRSPGGQLQKWLISMICCKKRETDCHSRLRCKFALTKSKIWTLT